MRTLFLITPLLLLVAGTVTVNAQTKPAATTKTTVNSPLTYPSFMPGKVYMKDNSVIEVSLNYNRLGDEILFVQDKKDTLAVSQPEAINKVVIGNDTYVWNAAHGFLQQLTSTPTVNLLEKSKLTFLGVEAEAGGYGGYTNTTASQSVTSMNNRNAGPGYQTTTKFGRDEKSIYSIAKTYFLSNTGNTMVTADKKGFNKMFPKHDQELKTFADANNISFTKKEDLDKLLQYAQTLK